MRSFVKIKSSQKGEITLSTTDIGESYHNHEILRSTVCLLTLFTKLKFSGKFPDLQYQIAPSKAVEGFDRPMYALS